MSEVPDLRARAWYRQPFVWLLIAIPSSSVLVGIVMLVFSTASFDGLVVDDYYKRGMEINRDLARDRAAAALELSAGAMLDAGTGEVRVDLASRDPLLTLPQQLTLRLLHPTRSGHDQIIQLRLDEDGLYSGELDPLRAGYWHLQLESESWRIIGRMPVPGMGLSDLSPAG